MTQRDRYTVTERYVVSQLDRRERGTQKIRILCETEWYYIGRQLYYGRLIKRNINMVILEGIW